MDNKNNETKEYTLTEEELNTVSGGAFHLKYRAYPVRNAASLFRQPLRNCLSQGHLRCPYCLLKLNLNLHKNPEPHKDGNKLETRNY